MSVLPTWHLEEAKRSLDNWYKGANLWLKYTPSFGIGKNLGNKRFLHCKTAGLVWHDRYKMVLDCNRSFK
jgi:hypothetical protein